MGSQELDAIRKRVAAATPGPWVSVYMDDEGDWAYHLASVDSQDVTYYIHDASQTYAKRDPNVGANAEFIAHARSDVPALLALLDEAVELLREGFPVIEYYAMAGDKRAGLIVERLHTFLAAFENSENSP